MFTCFRLIFWGLLLVIADLKIGDPGFNIFPDFPGYILVAIGCGGLWRISHRFSTACALSSVLAILDFAEFAWPDRIANLPAEPELKLSADCAMMWFLLGGVMHLSATQERRDISKRASTRRIMYVVMTGLVVAAALGWEFRPDNDRVAVWVASAVLVLSFCLHVVQWLILFLVHRAKYELVRRKGESPFASKQSS